MPARRKNTDSGRLKRSSKKSKLCDYFYSAYVQYLLIFVIWGVLLLINQSTEMRFEYFWPGWLFICSIHDSLKYQGLQYTIVFITIVITMDLICFFLFPASWIYSCGSAYVWVYLLWHTDQGLCFLTLTLCFIFVYFELGFYSRETKFNQSIYLFRPFAAHSIGYPVVCMGFSIKRYLDARHSKFKKMDVRKQNSLYFRILREAIPYSAITEPSSGACLPFYFPDDFPDVSDNDCSTDGSRSPLPWSLFLLQQLGKSAYAQFRQWSLYPASVNKECNGISPHTPCQALQRHPGTNNNSHTTSNGQLPNCSPCPDSTPRRPHTDGHAVNTSNRRCAVDGSTDSHSKAKQVNPAKGSGRYAKEDLTTRLENSIRRLRTEVQSMRAVEAQLRNQLTHLERDDRLNRLRLSDQRQKNESLSTEVAKRTSQARSERSTLTAAEQSVAEERRLREALESQLIEEATMLKTVEEDSSTCSTNGTESKTTIQPSDSCDTVASAANILQESCCQRRNALESDVYALRLAVKQQDDQLRILSTARAHQSHQQQQQVTRHTKHALLLSGDIEKSGQRTPGQSSANAAVDEGEGQRSLEQRVQRAVLESERLNNTLRQENWMKQDLLTSYHNSVREINDLNKTHKQRDFQILELTMKIEQLECLATARNTENHALQGRLHRGPMIQTSLTDPSMFHTTASPGARSALSLLTSSMTWRMDGTTLPGGCVSPHHESYQEPNPALTTLATAVTTNTSPVLISSADLVSMVNKHPTVPGTAMLSPSSCSTSVHGGCFLNPTRESDPRLMPTDYDTSTTHLPFPEAKCPPDHMSTLVRSGGVGCAQRLSTETH